MKPGIRIRLAAVRALKVVVVLSIVGLISMAGTVTYTARSEFCSTCHIMEPYFESWKASAHGNVDCVDCHYEPGLLETAEGKFKALSQLAKYVTGTQGTKPWAEVSDQSCMRSGCHSERLISGPIQFGRVKFDHRHHLLETRRGRRLRCTSCHSHVMAGEHMKVTETSCFLCHFRTSEASSGQGDCNTCHGPPPEDLVVEGQPFRHSDYTGRGVACTLCHRTITRGDGLAHKNRCSSCHGEEQHIERFSDTEFIHENHITIHKVECQECHDDIQHGLQDRSHPAESGSCGDCHRDRHGAQWEMYAGQGGVGVEPMPARMYATRVDCAGCHRDFWTDGGGKQASGVVKASDVSCFHCHGSTYDRMLESWQAEVDGALMPLEEALTGLEAATAGGEPTPALGDARKNLDLIRSDGSHGAHNIGYALALLRSTRDGINAAGPGLMPAFNPLDLEIGLPVASQTTCASACHVNAARIETRFGPVAFSHRAHLVKAGFDCNDCHSTDKHGQTVITPQDCKECHHEPDMSPSCATCHDREDRLLRGAIVIEGADLDLEDPMADLECIACHREGETGEPAAIVRNACVDCHEEGYDDLVDEWLAYAADEVAEVQGRIAAIEPRVRHAAGPAGAEARVLLARAKAGDAAVRDGRPAHTISGADSLLGAARAFLDRCEELLAQ